MSRSEPIVKLTKTNFNEMPTKHCVTLENSNSIFGTARLCIFLLNIFVLMANEHMF